MFYLAILLLSTTALAEKKVYEITGTVEYFSGLYVQTNQPFTFRQLKGPDHEGYFYYLYKEHDNAHWWYIGDGKKQSEITKIFKAYSWCSLLRFVNEFQMSSFRKEIKPDV